VLDQGNVGSCVGNAAAHALNTHSVHKIPSRLMREADAVDIYAAATAIDPWPGTYPQEDTGTDANSAAKVLRDRGLITSWQHCFGLDHVLATLQLAPVMLGISWHQSMFSPDAKGFVHPDGNVVGGHETLIRADDATGSVLVRNSWGIGWGLRGHYRLTYADLSALLADSGDATVLTA
jgi:C1A family cysteine protease